MGEAWGSVAQAQLGYRTTHRFPLGCSSDNALYLMMTELPLESSTSISSSSSMGARKALVGSIAVNLLYCCSHSLHTEVLGQQNTKHAICSCNCCELEISQVEKHHRVAKDSLSVIPSLAANSDSQSVRIQTPNCSKSTLQC